MRSDLALRVVIPVRDMAEHIGPCVRSLADQLRPGDEIVVVDDGSQDRSAAVAERAGARVLRRPGAGPYAARNAGAAGATQPALLFFDARCRAQPGLLDAHRALLARPGVALSCTQTVTEPGRTIASRAAALREPFALKAYIGVPGQLDYFPTANLGTGTSAFVRAGGFRELRSGADADFCWRVQRAGSGTLAADPAPLVHWIPRGRARDMLGQWRRYGKGRARLDAEHHAGPTAVRAAGDPAAPAAAVGRIRGRLRFAAGLLARLRHPRDLAALAVVLGSEVVFRYAYFAESRRIRRETPCRS